jgi:hypothetical protein
VEDFLKSSTASRERAERHDADRDRLEGAAASACEGVEKLLSARAANLLGDWMRERATDYPGGAVPRERFVRLLATHVVNRIRALPVQYTDHAFWARHGAEIRAIGAAAAEWSALDAAIARLLTTDREFAAGLEVKRDEILEQFDLPADPVMFVHEG